MWVSAAQSQPSLRAPQHINRIFRDRPRLFQLSHRDKHAHRLQHTQMYMKRTRTPGTFQWFHHPIMLCGTFNRAIPSQHGDRCIRPNCFLSILPLFLLFFSSLSLPSLHSHYQPSSSSNLNVLCVPPHHTPLLLCWGACTYTINPAGGTKTAHSATAPWHWAVVHQTTNRWQCHGERNHPRFLPSVNTG